MPPAHARSGLARAPLAALAVCGVVATFGCAVQVQSEGARVTDTQRFQVEGVATLELVTFDGPIEVKAWDRSEIQVQIEKTGGTRAAAESVRVDVERDGSRIRVVASEGSGSSLLNTIAARPRSARIAALVPRDANLELRASDGDIDIERVAGTLRLLAQNGAVRGVDLGGTIEVESGDGPVKLEHVSGSVRVVSRDGTVTVAGRPDALHVQADDGTVAVKVAPASRMTADWDVTSLDGAVVFYLPEKFDATIDAEAIDGAVRVARRFADMGIVADGQALRAALGAGGHVLKVRTGNGTISFKAF